MSDEITEQEAKEQAAEPKCPKCGSKMEDSFARVSEMSQSAVRICCKGADLSFHVFVVSKLSDLAKFFPVAQLREKERELAAARSAAFREAAQICEDEGAREACAVAEILRVKAAEKDHLVEPNNLISKDGQDGKCAPKGEEKP